MALPCVRHVEIPLKFHRTSNYRRRTSYKPKPLGGGGSTSSPLPEMPAARPASIRCETGRSGTHTPLVCNGWITDSSIIRHAGLGQHTFDGNNFGRISHKGPVTPALSAQHERCQGLAGKSSPNVHRFSPPNGKLTLWCAPCLDDCWWQTQVLSRPFLDDKLQLRSKICNARGIGPASYVIRQELIHVGRVHYRGGLADVSDGEYQEFKFPVAIKHPRTKDGNPGRIFKVPSTSRIPIADFRLMTTVDLAISSGLKPLFPSGG